MSRNLSQLYFTPSLSTSLGGVKRLTSNQKSGKRIKASNALKWLRGQEAYTLHKPVRTKFSRRKTIVSGIGEQLQTDLIDVQRYKKSNDNVSYLLTAIDVFSKKAWVVPIQSKSGQHVCLALQSILEESHFHSIQSDKGKEYLNKRVQSLFREMGVTHFTTENETIKASVIERFNRTLQTAMHRWMSHTNAERFVDILKDLVASYNESYHSSIGVAPNAVTEENQEDIWWKLYPPSLQHRKARLKEGDYVRISKARRQFHKGYTASWSVEIYVISGIRKTTPIVYEIRDLNEEIIRGTFYEQELQKVDLPKTYRIEKVLKRRTVGRKKQIFVKWIGYPPSFNQWISENHIT